MKTFIISVVCGGLVFIVSLVFMLQSSPPRHEADKPKGTTLPVVGLVQKSKSSAKFPDDLTAVLQGQGVAQAPKYKPADKNRLALLDSSGQLHEWHEKVPDDWRADTVEDTELVVEVGEEQSVALETRKYYEIRTKKPAPPITRYQFSRTIVVREAQSGFRRAYKRFVNQPPPFQDRVDYRVTALGRPVDFAEVFEWVTGLTRTGFQRPE